MLMRKVVSWLMASVGCAACSAQVCEPVWSDAFVGGGVQSSRGNVQALHVFCDGSVTRLVVAGALAMVTEIADTPGYSVLACGIGSLTRALGDREAAETGNQEVLSHAKRVGVADMITANIRDIEERVQQGFLALLMQGPDADGGIRIGRAAAGG